MIQIWHNPRCSKSRNAVNYLKEENKEFEVKEYLKEDITKEELENLLVKLNLSVKDIIRDTESIYKELNLKNENDEEKLIEAILANKKLIQRPIVVVEDKAVLGRPLENIMELVKNK